MIKSHKPKVTIGFPVYNGEQFLQKSLESLLTQSYSNFELVISDNASEDSTPRICTEFINKDNRIIYYRQPTNMEMAWNFNFVLKKATGEYFMWAAADDIHESTFIEECVNLLEKKPRLVGCISNVKPYSIDNKDVNYIDILFHRFVRKIISSIRPFSARTLSGSYEKKIRTLLKESAYEAIYGLFKTKYLKRSIIPQSFVGHDVVILLNVLKYGDFENFDKVLMYKFDKGFSTKGSISLAKQFNNGIRLGSVFPHFPLTFWFIKNLGVKTFVRNIDHFLILNIGSEILLVIDLLRVFLKKLI